MKIAVEIVCPDARDFAGDDGYAQILFLSGSLFFSAA